MHSDGRNNSRKLTHHDGGETGHKRGTAWATATAVPPLRAQAIYRQRGEGVGRRPAAGVDLAVAIRPWRKPETRRGSVETGGGFSAACRSGADDPAGTDGEPKGARKEGSAYFQVTTPFAEQHDPEITTVIFSALPTKKPVETAMSWLIFNSPVWLIKTVKPQFIVIKTCYLSGLLGPFISE
ncbi:hypothetical protein AB1E22_00155 [Buttiauxella gaviniae]|uniref:Uncharacterized protein n=1 Tax=Buttiauxella gaviniae TaxID=82990 RepID=A0ABV3NNM7_9ENTR